MRPHLLARCVVTLALLLGTLRCERPVAITTLAIMRAGDTPIERPQAHLILTPDAITLRAEGATLAQVNLDAQALSSMRAASRGLDLPALTAPLHAHLRQQREVADARCARASSQDAPTHCGDVTRAAVWIEARAETPYALIVHAIATAAQAEATDYALLVRDPDGALRAINGAPPKSCAAAVASPAPTHEPLLNALQASRAPCVMPALTLTREGLRLSAHDSVEDWSCGAGIIARASREEAPLIGPRDASGIDLEAARAALRALSQREALCPHVTLRAGAEVRWDEVVQVADLAREGAPERHVSWSLIRDEVQPPQ